MLMTQVDIDSAPTNVYDIATPLANSSFQSLNEENDNLSLSGAQSTNITDHNQTPTTPPFNPVDTSSKDNINLGTIPQLNVNDDTPNKSTISIAGLEPILSPRKQLQKLFTQPIDNKPRLVIKKLILTNFKSYAGRQEIGPFHASFSAVVGPNGSGKSNVIDSMLFVFGFRASKMRQSKLKELIHNSESFPNLDFCQVDIHFEKIIDNYDVDGNNTNNPTILENSSLVVSRRANKNNSSTYYINNKTSTYTEVTTLLKDEGIDLDHKRFLILQGEVEMIAQMKPKAENENDDGLLEYLEDIIGTSSYKEEIEKITTEIEHLQENFDTKERVFEFTNKDFTNNTEVEKDKALEFLRIEKKYKDETVKYWHLKGSSELKFVEKYESKLSELNDKIKDDQDLIKHSKKQMEVLKNQKNAMIKDLNDVNVAIGKSKNRFKSLEKEQVSLNENLKINQKKSDSLTKTLNSNKKTLTDNQYELNELKEKSTGCSDEVAQLNQSLEIEIQKLDKIKAELSSETKIYSDQIEKLQKKLEPWKNKIDKNQSDFNIRNSEVELLKNQLTSITDEHQKIKSSLNEKNEQIQINNSKIESLTSEKSKLQSNVDRIKIDFKTSGEKLKQTEYALNAIRDKVQFAKNKVSSVESQNKVLSALTRLQETGRVTGFYGKLGDLGVIDDQYDVAVSTGGGALSDYVVETVEDAQNCIQYLRQNNLGFGKFIVLQKLRKFNTARINTPENVPRLFDLIKPIDPKFSPAFYSSMYDTLVAPNLAVANRVAFGGSKRWRVVTLDGKLVDVSGTMSGGGTRVSRGAMKLASKSSANGDTVSQQQLESWRQSLLAKEEEYIQTERTYRKTGEILRKAEEDVPRMMSEILKLNMDNGTLTDEIKELGRSLKDLSQNKQQIDSLNKKIDNYSKDLEKLKVERSKLEENTNELQNQINELNKKILDIGGLKLKVQTSNVQSVKDTISLKLEMKTNDELKMAKLQNQNVKLSKLVETSEIQLNDLKYILETLKNDYNSIVAKVSEAESEVNELEHQRDEKSLKISEINDEIEKEDTSLREKSELISDALKQINKVETLINKTQLEIKHAEGCIKNIEYRDVEPYVEWMDEDDEQRDELIQKPLDLSDKSLEDELNEIDLKQLGDIVDSLKTELNDLVSVDIEALITYGEKKNQYEDQKKDLENARQSLKEIKEKGEDLNERRHSEFKEGFNAISSTLKNMYYLITAGGMAELEYYDSHDAFSEGIVFSVMPPKKSWRTISNLSGGEKTLASLALVFALHHYKPTPLYVMDEIDAALDFKNVSIVANYIKSRTKNAQFIVISLRNNMFELAESLVGIYKVNNMTKSATLVNKDLI